MASPSYSPRTSYSKGDTFSLRLASGPAAIVTVTQITGTGFAAGRVVAYSDGSPAKSGGCDTEDVVVLRANSVQVWAACNVGQSVFAARGRTYANESRLRTDGEHFQFGTDSPDWTDVPEEGAGDWKLPGGADD